MYNDQKAGKGFFFLNLNSQMIKCFVLLNGCLSLVFLI